MHILALCLLQVIGETAAGESCAAARDRDEIDDVASFLATDTRLIDIPKAESQKARVMVAQGAEQKATHAGGVQHNVNQGAKSLHHIKKTGPGWYGVKKGGDGGGRASKAAGDLSTSPLTSYLRDAKKALKKAMNARNVLNRVQRKKISGDITAVRKYDKQIKRIQATMKKLKAQRTLLTAQAKAIKKKQFMKTARTEQLVKFETGKLKKAANQLQSEKKQLAAKVQQQDKTALAAFLKAQKQKAKLSNISKGLLTVFRKDRATYQSEMANVTKKKLNVTKNIDKWIAVRKANRTKLQADLKTVVAGLKGTKAKEASIIKRVHKIAAGLKTITSTR